jgi:alanine-glyoxylate transaminase / serine-glyoxylate transaminase / serine-pyruvate transaminase
MTLQFGRPMVAIPGPSIVPDRVLNAMHRPMANIYDGELVEMTNRLKQELPAIARTTADVFLTISNGHGAWEMAITNTLSRGDKVLVLESGHFAPAWGALATTAGVDVEILPGSLDRPVDPAAVEARLREDVDHELRAVLVVQVDTGTTVRNDIAAIRSAIDAADHPALFMVDCIASLGCVRYEMDAWGVDVTVAATQKGLMVPPGMAFVWANGKALAAYETSDLHTGYWDWGPRLDKEAPHYYQYAGTPPVSHIYGMIEALDMLAEEGLENVWRRHDVLARSVHAAVDAWSTPDGLSLNVGDPDARAATVTTVLTGSIDGERLRAICESRMGLTLGIPFGAFDGRAFRIGHMGHLNPPMLLGTLGSIEAGLQAMDAPLAGSGVAAAAGVIAEELRT